MNFVIRLMFYVALLLVPQLVTCIPLEIDGPPLSVTIVPVADPLKGIEGNASVLDEVNGEGHLILSDGIAAIGELGVDGLAAAGGEINASSDGIAAGGYAAVGDLVGGGLGVSLDKDGSVHYGGSLNVSSTEWSDLEIDTGKENPGVSYQVEVAGIKVVDANVTADGISVR